MPRQISFEMLSSPIIHGAAAGLMLSIFYFILVGYLESFSHAVEAFTSTFLLTIPLVASFGILVALHSSIRRYIHVNRNVNVTASGGISAGSMIACCAHHITDALPFIGISLTTSILTTYQPLFMAVGLLVNIVVILTIFMVMKEHYLYSSSSQLAKVMRINLRKMRNYSMVIFPILLLGMAWSITASQGVLFMQPGSQLAINLPSTKALINGIEIAATPLPFIPGQDVSFRISFDTHAGSLDFDAITTIYMDDNLGNRLFAKSWSGTQPGGHHKEITITFPPLPDKTNEIRLIISNITGTDQTFEWRLTP